MFGGLGNDSVFGDAGRDTIQGNEGTDTLRGARGTVQGCHPRGARAEAARGTLSVPAWTGYTGTGTI